jgi:hypothetical protein
VQDRRNDVERLVARTLEHVDTNRRLSERARHTQRSVEAYLRAGVRPRWMERLIEIEAAIASQKRRLARAHRMLALECDGDPELFAVRWQARAHRWRFDDLNELIRQHNDWYPIERDLPMNPRTGDYVLVGGRSYRRPELDADWVLEQFPPVPPAD